MTEYILAAILGGIFTLIITVCTYIFGYYRGYKRGIYNGEEGIIQQLIKSGAAVSPVDKRTPMGFAPPVDNETRH
jgi:hypothetical protein